MAGPLFFLLSSIILGIVFELLALDQAIQEQQIDGAVAINISALGVHMSMLLVLCHYSEKLTNLSYAVGDMVFCEIAWYKMSIEHQKILIFLIRRAQKSFRLRGYGLFDCSLEVFQKVSLDGNF